MYSSLSLLRPALFLDRDGVINIEKNYVYRIEDFDFVDGIFDLCHTALKCNMLIVVVTNQSGIGRGLYSEKQFIKLTNWMCDKFAENKISISAVYHCPFHPLHGLEGYRRESYDRKPNPGMIFRARENLNIDLSKSVLIGDKVSDIDAAKAAHIGLSLLLSKTITSSFSDIIVTSLHEAKQRILKFSNGDF